MQIDYEQGEKKLDCNSANVLKEKKIGRKEEREGGRKGGVKGRK